MGYDGTRKELWNLLEKKFSDNGTAVKDSKVLSDYLVVANYPNPFNPSTNINIKIPYSGNLKVELFNILGEKVAVLFDGYTTRNSIVLKWNGTVNRSPASGGVYFCVTSLTNSNGDNLQKIHKMILLK